MGITVIDVVDADAVTRTQAAVMRRLADDSVFVGAIADGATIIVGTADEIADVYPDWDTLQVVEPVVQYRDYGVIGAISVGLN